MPDRDVVVGDSRGDIEHDDTTLAVDVVTVTEATELLLSGGVPDVECDGAAVLGMNQNRLEWIRCDGNNNSDKKERTYGGESDGVNLDTESGKVLLLELAGQMALDEGGLWWVKGLGLNDINNRL